MASIRIMAGHMRDLYHRTPIAGQIVQMTCRYGHRTQNHHHDKHGETGFSNAAGKKHGYKIAQLKMINKIRQSTEV